MVIFKLNSFLCFFLIITKDSNNKVNDPSAKFLQLLSKHKFIYCIFAKIKNRYQIRSL